MRKNFQTGFLLVILVVTIIKAQGQGENIFNVQDFINSPPITVTVGGEFLVTGSFTSFSGERVDQFITRIYNEARSRINVPSNNDKLFLKIISNANEYALRGIKLKRKDGTEANLDLLKFRLTGNFDENPYLKNDDVIIFPGYDINYDFIDIRGAVNKPTKFQFLEGDKLSDAIFFARGINQAYKNVDTAFISRLSYDGATENSIKVAIEDDFKLKRGDRIKLLSYQTRRKDYKVLVVGEVNNPGYVHITENTTTLREVINKSGGITSEASLKDAEIIRNLNREQVLLKYAIDKKASENPAEFFPTEEETKSWSALETLRMLRTADLLEDDTLFFNLNNQLRIMEGVKLFDFSKLDSTGSYVSNFIVKNEDIIIIPEKFNAVYVFGQVGKAGYYEYVNDTDYEYYIKVAGGLAGTAKDDDEIYIIKGTSREWIKIDDGKQFEIEPGDYIYVAKEIPRDIWYYIARVGTIAGILGSIATIVLLFK